MHLFEALAKDLERLIREGQLRPGSRLPSVRALCRERSASPSTAVRALEWLQARGLVESRPRSGFYVTSAAARRDAQPIERRVPRRVDVADLAFHILDETRQRKAVPLGSAFPSPELFPFEALGRSLAYVGRHLDPWATTDDLPPGNAALRRLIAQRYRLMGAAVAADEIVITAGALEALNLALLAVTRPDEVVAIESPTFYGCLQAIQAAGRRAVEIPTHPGHGVDVGALERILTQVPVRACWFMTTFQNPLGCTLPTPEKRRLVQLLASHRIPLIDDNVYAELYFTKSRQPPAKVFDREGLVIDCGSFSKSLAPGFRIGWAACGRFASAVRRCKVTSSLATSMPMQAAIAHFVASGRYERHLRGLRRSLLSQQASLIEALQRHLPPGCRWHKPDGGYQIWIELPASVDALELHATALAAGISIAPGPLFSASRGFSHAVRLNYGYPWSSRIDSAIRRLGEMIRERAATGARP